ncbi:flagellin biosynthesis protein FlgD [Salipiger aestuarii]|uniref:Basal-body rod modification protein FlgD n=2 Tax=Salipiger aestuarii TaxID=568098 RepID=A0A327XZ26_9RHOB|nr:flagellar hook capping FlgD N-terminal domain-containing protein [Salipiger aestuarii]KAA8606735.1 flagellin biosynthesis protein FlgD [Salipiger aestuarii]KAA8610584.1 flagellin biosynthesis protein FlgD [Salipiger aestuarii]KAB2541351.1 flagellin biosynthesis protein FlgD [Salipiger aestuarii]RAK13983.1 flagellar basal-body rod modification protein FlgD [Salipiger aestuarii]
MDTGTVTSSTATTASAASSAASKNPSTPVVSSDFETFLKMLTAQMQNQDPLDPLDSADYATQLATFSSVEQQVLTNDLLTDLTAALTNSSFKEMGAWIDRKVLADAPVYFNGNPVVMRPEYADGVNSAKLVVKNDSGAAVQTLALDMSDPMVAWAGLGSDGTQLASGTYSFSIQSYTDGVLKSESPAQVYNPVIEVRQVGDAIKLTLSDGSEVDAEEITAVR